MFDVIIFLAGLMMGSFINVLATRVLHQRPFFTARSACPSCHTIIAWYDNIPLISFIVLRARCRTCNVSISWLYPATELAAGFLAVILAQLTNDPIIYTAYSLFLLALLAATRTDLEAMLIPQLFSLWMVPIGVACAYLGYIEITLTESLLGAAAGYGLLWSIAALFRYFTQRDGLGEGDMELLACIGSFLGPLGIWLSLLIGSMVGLVIGVALIISKQHTLQTRIPFGPLLALGAIIYLVKSSWLLACMFGL